MKEQILKQVALFASLPPDELKHLAEILHYREFSPGTVFIHESEIADHFFILIEGEIEVIKALGTTNERALGVDEAGSFIGEMGLIAQRPRSATIQAEAASVLYELNANAYETIKREHPALSQALLGYVIAVMTERLSFANRLIGVLQR